MSDKEFDPMDVSCYVRPVQKKGKKHSEEDEVIENEFLPKLDSLADDFSTVLESLLDYARQGLEVSHNSVDNNLSGYYRGLSAIVKGTTKRRADFEMVLGFKGKDEKSEERQYVIPIQDVDMAFKVQDYLSAAIAAPRILCSSILQQLVNTWEGFVGNCLSMRIDYRKKLISNKLVIPYEAVRNIRDVSDLHRFAIEQTVGEIMRQSTRGQLMAFKDFWGIDALSWLKDTKTLEEIVYRRHMLVHCDGVATGVYCKQVSKLGLAEPKTGTDISPTFSYLLGAWDEVFSTGAILSHLIAYQSLKEGLEKGAERFYGERADAALLSRSYMALEKKRFNVVRRIGEYVRQRKLYDEWEQKALYVNLALAYKQLKKEKDFQSVIDELDEHACPADFEAPIACLHGDFDKAFRIVKRGCKQRDFCKAKEDIKALVKWPVYAELRKTSKCAAFLKSEEMKSLIAKCEKIDPKIDFKSKDSNPDGALKELFVLCQEKANAYKHIGV